MNLALILMAISVLLGLALALVVYRARIVTRILPPFSYLFVLLCGLGIALIHLVSTRMLEKMAERQWPTVKGLVVSSEVSQTRGLQPVIRYRYELNGQTYFGTTDLRLPAFGGRVNRLEASEAVVEYYHPGREVVVHYDPLNPSNSSLRVGPTWDLYMKLSLGVFLLLMGTAGITTGILLGRISQQS